MSQKSEALSMGTSDLKSQEAYVRKMEQAEFDFSLTVGDAFVRGIRDIGYKSSATAVYELIDNAMQAGAENVHVVLGFEGKSDAKPTTMAVIDDGHGMIPDMIRLAILWGGTHREGNREGSGRYGFGLPSACVSQGRRFTVYSRTEDADFHSVTLDVDDISAGKYNDGGRVIAPQTQVAQLPGWVKGYIKERTSALPVRTVIVLEKLDRLTWKTASALERQLLQQFGVTYRNYLRNHNLFVEGKRVEPLDPLFITEGAKFYDLDEDRAEPLEPLAIDVKDRDAGTVLGTIKVRFSYMPPTFQRKDKTKERGSNNPRLDIMKDHNGIIVLRNGRQIDVVTKIPWTVLMTYDRNWAVEVDFPATLDEEFAITTSKQQVVLTERMWDLLREHGVYRAIEQMRKRLEEDNSKLKARREEDEARKRASELAMEEAEKYKAHTAPETEERQKKAKEVLELEARRRAKQAGVPVKEVERQLVAEVSERPYKVEQHSSAGAPFFSVEQRGGQKVLILNTAHRFYTNVYAGHDSTPRLRAGIEVLLFVLGDTELDATEDRQLFYRVERGEWSTRLDVTLAQLDRIDAAQIEVLDDLIEESGAASAEVGAS